MFGVRLTEDLIRQLFLRAQEYDGSVYLRFESDPGAPFASTVERGRMWSEFAKDYELVTVSEHPELMILGKRSMFASFRGTRDYKWFLDQRSEDNESKGYDL